MGLFGPAKIKVTPRDFVKSQLDEIFSPSSIEAEKKQFMNLSKEIRLLQKVSTEKYVKERLNVICNLFQIAWDRNSPQDIFMEYSLMMQDDSRVKAVDTGVYDSSLSKAQQNGMDAFGYISKVFLSQIIPQGIDKSDTDYSKLYVIYGTDVTSRYKSFEASVKQCKFIK